MAKTLEQRVVELEKRMAALEDKLTDQDKRLKEQPKAKAEPLGDSDHGMKAKEKLGKACTPNY